MNAETAPEHAVYHKCLNCKHCNRKYIKGPICYLGTSELKEDPVVGTKYRTLTFCRDARRPSGICGPEGRLFEPKGNWSALIPWLIAGGLSAIVIFRWFV